MHRASRSECVDGAYVAVFQYNVSRNDHYRGIETCSGTFDAVRAHNNTI
ncbi:hypothetical protein ABZ622_20250 [Streptomyces sp. NPDC007164]